jgi:hypothetical protein
MSAARLDSLATVMVAAGFPVNPTGITALAKRATVSDISVTTLLTKGTQTPLVCDRIIEACATTRVGAGFTEL